MSEEAIVRVHAENLMARKVVAYATKDGRITDVLEGPNYPVRQRAVTDAWRLHDRLVERGQAATQKGGCVIVRLSPENARMMERLRGEPLPDTIEIEPEQSMEATAPPVAATPDAALDVPPKPESTSAAGSAQTKGPEVPPLPRDTAVLTWRQARDLARLRGEPERTINIFVSMGPYNLVISGQTFKQLCGKDEGSHAAGVSQST